MSPSSSNRDRRELVRLMVLNEICDDGENIDQIILPHLAKLGAKLGWTVERAEVVAAMTSLVEEGLAVACHLSPFPGEFREFFGMPPVHEIEEYFSTYFFVTEKGKQLHLSDDSWWPFGDLDYREALE